MVVTSQIIVVYILHFFINASEDYFIYYHCLFNNDNNVNAIILRH